jgi:hypothetical protein
MKYELILETATCLSFSVFPHDRKGLTAAFDRVNLERNKDGFLSAKIVSDRDGDVFVLDCNLVSA